MGSDAIGRLVLWIAFWLAVFFVYVVIIKIFDDGLNPYVLLGILVFVSTLALMDAMTYMTWKRTYKTAKDMKGELDKIKEELPPADKTALLFPEPINVLDRREIRRSLIITFTIIYIILLFQGERSLLEHFTWIYFAMISFYFGSRALDRFAEVKGSKDR